MHVKSLICVTLLAFTAFKPVKCISPEQLEKLSQTMRKNCLQKIDTTEDAVEGLRSGQFPADPNLACYTNCIMKTIRSFKNGAIDYDMMMKQVDLTFPSEIGARMKENIRKCQREYTGDPCTMSYDYVKCMYEVDPEMFVFP